MITTVLRVHHRPFLSPQAFVGGVLESRKAGTMAKQCATIGYVVGVAPRLLGSGRVLGIADVSWPWNLTALRRKSRKVAVRCF